MKCLFIGGPKAGCIVEMNTDMPSVRVPVVPVRPATFSDLNLAAHLSVTEFVVYKRDVATDKTGNRHIIYVCGEEDPLITLMNFYAEAHKQ